MALCSLHHTESWRTRGPLTEEAWQNVWSSKTQEVCGFRQRPLDFTSQDQIPFPVKMPILELKLYVAALRWLKEKERMMAAMETRSASSL